MSTYKCNNNLLTCPFNAQGECIFSSDCNNKVKINMTAEQIETQFKSTSISLINLINIIESIDMRDEGAGPFYNSLYVEGANDFKYKLINKLNRYAQSSKE